MSDANATPPTPPAITPPETPPPPPTTPSTPSKDASTSTFEFADAIIGEEVRYRLIKPLGIGGFSDVYEAIALDDSGEVVAVKLAKPANSISQSLLQKESEVYKVIQGGEGIPEMKWYGEQKGNNVMVLNLLGLSLQDYFAKCSHRFTLKTVLMLAPQMIERVKWLHEKTLVHCDLKPSNFLMGLGQNSNDVYLIDFGLVRKYPMERNIKDRPTLHGNPRFSSINNHCGGKLTPRDDLESLGYIFVYFLSGSLPWDGVDSEDKREYYRQIKEMKKNIPVQELCQICPAQFMAYLNYCRDAESETIIDYGFLQGLFRDLSMSLGYISDPFFDWEKPVKREKRSC